MANSADSERGGPIGAQSVRKGTARLPSPQRPWHSFSLLSDRLIDISYVLQRSFNTSVLTWLAHYVSVCFGFRTFDFLLPGTQQRQAHESPVLFYSVIMGSLGPLLAFGVPPIRKQFGWQPAELLPITYPSECLDSLVICRQACHKSFLLRLNTYAWNLTY